MEQDHHSGATNNTLKTQSINLRSGIHVFTFKAWYLWCVFSPTGLMQLLTDLSFPRPENYHCQFRCVDMECEFSIHLSLKCWIFWQSYTQIFGSFYSINAQIIYLLFLGELTSGEVNDKSGTSISVFPKPHQSKHHIYRLSQITFRETHASKHKIYSLKPWYLQGDSPI